MAEGLFSDGWDWAPKQFASDDQSPLRAQSSFLLFSLLYFLDHSSLSLLIRINSNYTESNENSVLLR